MGLVIYIGIGLAIAVGFLIALRMNLNCDTDMKKLNSLLKDAELITGVTGGQLIVLIFITLTLFYPFVIVGTLMEEK